MGVLYAMVGFVAVPSLLAVFHQLSKRPEMQSARPAGGVAEEAETWLRSQTDR